MSEESKAGSGSLLFDVHSQIRDANVIVEFLRVLCREDDYTRPYDSVLEHASWAPAPMNVASVPYKWVPLPLSGIPEAILRNPVIGYVKIVSGDNVRVLFGKIWRYDHDIGDETGAFNAWGRHWVYLQPVLSDHAIQIPEYDINTSKTVEIFQFTPKDSVPVGMGVVGDGRMAMSVASGWPDSEPMRTFTVLFMCSETYDLKKINTVLDAVLQTQAEVSGWKYSATQEDTDKDAHTFDHVNNLFLANVKNDSSKAQSVAKAITMVEPLPPDSIYTYLNSFLYRIRADFYTGVQNVCVALDDSMMKWHVVQAANLNVKNLYVGVPAIRMPEVAVPVSNGKINVKGMTANTWAYTAKLNFPVGGTFTSKHPDMANETSMLGVTAFSPDCRHNVEAMSVPPIDYDNDVLAVAFKQGTLVHGRVTDPNSILSVYSKSYMLLHSCEPVEFARIVHQRLARLRATSLHADNQYLHGWLYNAVEGGMWTNDGLWSTGSLHKRRNPYNNFKLMTVQQRMLGLYYHSTVPLFSNEILIGDFDKERNSRVFWRLRYREYLNYYSRYGFVVTPVHQFVNTEVRYMQAVTVQSSKTKVVVTIQPEDMLRIDASKELRSQ